MEDVYKEGLAGSIIKIYEDLVTNHLNEIVVETVEQTLNGLLEAEADQLCGVAISPVDPVVATGCKIG